jgi:anti-sigma B factor antagonist
LCGLIAVESHVEPYVLNEAWFSTREVPDRRRTRGSTPIVVRLAVKVALKHIRLRKVGSVAVIAPKGNLVGGDETDELRELLADLAGAGNCWLVVNFRDVTFITSIALGVFAHANATFRNRGGEIAICHTDAKVSNIFVVTKLIFLFDHHDNEDRAIAALAAKASTEAGPVQAQASGADPRGHENPSRAA